jgi:EAL domain-containing protein (putative c-di-GMP-specific phosphodiesterase class I)/FixJ family two-component response regulator
MKSTLAAATQGKTIRHGTTDPRPVMLVVDDDPLFCAQVGLFSGNKFQVYESYGPSKVELDTLLKADVVILDLSMPDEDGIEFLRTLATLSPHPKLLIVSGYEQRVIDMAKRTAELYGMQNTSTLRKPFKRKTFTKVIDSLCSLTNVEDASVSSQTGLHANQDEVLTGMRAGEFIPFYQPQVCITNSSVIGIEALARWDHPKLGILTPDKFIDTIELSELASEFTMLIMESAMKDYVKLVAGTGFQGSLSVNVPSEVFAKDDFTDQVVETARRLNFPKEKLVCEITERGMENIGVAITATFTRLKMHGVQLSVDDFGIGQSGLSKIKYSMFDEIKIDRTFIKDLTSSLSSRLIVKNVLNLATQSELRVVAEGIEDERTLACLGQLGCTIAQGYYFSGLVPVAGLTKLIRNWRSRPAET